MKTHYIYKITNTITGKIYVGKRICSCNYLNDGYLGSSKILTNIIQKRGRDILKKEILEICTQENLSEREIYWIETLQSTNPEIGYNLTLGGTGGSTNRGRVFSQEWRDKISKARKAQGATENHLSAKRTPEYRLKQSQISKAIWSDEKVREKQKSTTIERKLKGEINPGNRIKKS